MTNITLSELSEQERYDVLQSMRGMILHTAWFDIYKRQFVLSFYELKQRPDGTCYQGGKRKTIAFDGSDGEGALNCQVEVGMDLADFRALFSKSETTPKTESKA